MRQRESRMTDSASNPPTGERRWIETINTVHESLRVGQCLPDGSKIRGNCLGSRGVRFETV